MTNTQMIQAILAEFAARIEAVLTPQVPLINSFALVHSGYLTPTESGPMVWGLEDLDEARTYCAQGEEPIRLWSRAGDITGVAPATTQSTLFGISLTESMLTSLVREYGIAYKSGLPEQEARLLRTFQSVLRVICSTRSTPHLLDALSWISSADAHSSALKLRACNALQLVDSEKDREILLEEFSARRLRVPDSFAALLQLIADQMKEDRQLIDSQSLLIKQLRTSQEDQA